jgi:SAM-dependent methyltransferase
MSSERAPTDGTGDAAALAHFYDGAYSHGPSHSSLYSGWRALSAVGKADHVLMLCERARFRPTSTLDVGCGDGALLCELRRRSFGGRLTGLEISDSAVSLAGQRAEIDAVARYDGERLPGPDAAHDLGLLSHVLEHVPEPDRLLAEVARACNVVFVEVPLETNMSARRSGKRAHAAQIGHLQSFDRGAVRELVRRSGLSLLGELEDPLPLAVHRFFARGMRGHALMMIKWALRTSLHRLMPGLARRLFTVHYACLCTRSPPAALGSAAHPR